MWSLPPYQYRPEPPARKGSLLEEWLNARLEEESDLTLKEYCAAFEEDRGVKSPRLP